MLSLSVSNINTPATDESLQKFFFFFATFFTAGDEGSTVTHNESIISGKHKRRQDKSFHSYRSSAI